MAKKNNSKSTSLPPWMLFAISAALLTAAWLMKSFPILIFAGYAPLFAIADQSKEQDSPWSKFELILLALGISFFAATIFNSSLLIVVLAQAIVFTLCFVGYNFCYQNLGPRLGKFAIIFFWLAIEYLLLKLPWRDKTIFLTDALLLHPSWTLWNSHTGYLAASLWILLINLFIYLTFFHDQAINWYYLTVAILLTAGPIAYSYTLSSQGVNREQMIALYSGAGSELPIPYQKQGELIPRTATWISLVILLLAFVKSKTTKT